MFIEKRDECPAVKQSLEEEAGRKALEIIADLIYKKGQEYTEKDLEKAIQKFNNAIKINPNHYKAYNALAGAHAEEGNFDKAEENQKKAIEAIERKGSEWDKENLLPEYKERLKSYENEANKSQKEIKN